KDRQFSVQAFKTAGSLFEVIDSRTQDILVPWNDEARILISGLEQAQTPEQSRALLRKAQQYSVGVYNLRKLDEVGAVRTLPCGVTVLAARFYDKDCGVVTEGAEQELLVF
ncbi:MAG: CRISPR-associated helicase/endonuclease Cas3, partial [Oscillospiraceae bacterium]|nr:CRISPR-associated helicase/endonuclease Cas3 [Oscillospiraceae bacterium]